MASAGKVIRIVVRNCSSAARTHSGAGGVRHSSAQSSQKLAAGTNPWSTPGSPTLGVSESSRSNVRGPENVQEGEISNQKAEKHHSENIKSEVNQIRRRRESRAAPRNEQKMEIKKHSSRPSSATFRPPASLLRLMCTQFMIRNHKFPSFFSQPKPKAGARRKNIFHFHSGMPLMCFIFPYSLRFALFCRRPTQGRSERKTLTNYSNVRREREMPSSEAY
jgi:hypothetical protein